MTAIVVKITHLEPMEGYDSIELATVLGWQVVVKRGEFVVGDLGCYYSIGGCLPLDGPTGFLQGKPLRTKRFRKYISQGLLLPLSVVNISGVEGEDVTERLGVKKFIPPEEKELYEASAEKGPWYPFVPKTDEERVQNCVEELAKRIGRQIVITRKDDGTSSTYIWLGSSLGVYNRNNHLLTVTPNSKIYFDMAKKYNIEAGMRDLGRNLALQGEIIGPKINGNRHGESEVSLHIFNIYDITAGCYLGWEEVVNICGTLGLTTVTEVYRGPLLEEHCSVEGLMKIATATLPNGRLYEGIVLKTIDNGPRYSCKCISNEYILKYNM